jgi:opacity protein-like surface antigen
MRPKSSSKIHTNIPLLILAIFVLLAQPSGNAVAEDLFGLYVGGAIGQSQVQATAPQLLDFGHYQLLGAGSFKENHSAFKVMVGLRPISLFGAELAYIDLGHPSGSFSKQTNGDVSMRGAAAFGVLYLPVPLIDIFLKAGVARLQSALHGTGTATVVCPNDSSCPGAILPDYPFRLDRTNTGFAAGAGAQYRIGSWAVRAEYERFNAAGGKPTLLSAGVTWSFF